MVAHRARHSSPGRLAGRHIAAVGYVGPTPALIGLQKIGAKDLPCLFGDKYLVPRCVPVGERFLARHVRGQSIGVARADHSFEDFPDGIGVAVVGGPDMHALMSQRRCRGVNLCAANAAAMLASLPDVARFVTLFAYAVDPS